MINNYPYIVSSILWQSTSFGVLVVCLWILFSLDGELNRTGRMICVGAIIAAMGSGGYRLWFTLGYLNRGPGSTAAKWTMAHSEVLAGLSFVVAAGCVIAGTPMLRKLFGKRWALWVATWYVSNFALMGAVGNWLQH